jgi:hypothetical protein
MASPERVDADRQQQPHQRVQGEPLHRLEDQHLGPAAERGEQQQAQVDAGLHLRGQQASPGELIQPPDQANGGGGSGDQPARHGEPWARAGR